MRKNLQLLGKKNQQREASGGIVEELDSEGLVLALSGILNNPNLPEQIYDALKASLNDVFNTVDQDDILEFENSPEYLEMLFRGAKKK